MIASKGGITMQDALKMTRAQARDWCYSLAIVQGYEVDWRSGEIRQPKESK